MHAAGTPPHSTIAAVALLAGSLLALAMPVPLAFPVSLAAAAVAAAWCLRAGRARPAAIALVGFALASAHAGYALDARIASSPPKHDDEIVARVVSLPRAEPRRVVFDVDVEAARNGVLIGRTVRIAWYHDRDVRPPAVGAGERWRLPVRIKAPRGLRNPGASDAERHALADRLAAVGYVRGGVPRRIGAAQGLQAWRERVSARIDAAVDGEASRFVRALAIGDTRALTEADWRTLRADGLTHLIAISGFHVGMVAGVAVLLVRAAWWWLPLLARRIPARIAGAAVGFVAALAYAGAAGFSMPTIRTVLMIGIVAGVHAARRRAEVGNVLGLSAIAIVIADPLALLGAGFWLSFAGVAWLAWCLPRDEGPPWRGLLRAQAVASLGLLPLGVLFFDQASLAGPLANLVAVPLWSLVVAPLAVAGVALDSVSPGLASAAWNVAAAAFEAAWPAFERLAGTAFALLWIPQTSAFALPLGLVGAAWLLMPRGSPGRILGAILLLPLLWPDRRLPRAGEVEITAIDVGQGLSVLVRTRSHAVLYDAGPAIPDGFDAGERAVVPVLRAKGITVLDRLVVSHGDNDHAGGVEAVLAEIDARTVIAPDGSPLRGTRACRAGERWDYDGVAFEFLHPPLHFPYLANESSCVLRIATGHGVVLLTGDIGGIVERRLVDYDARALRADVVFAAHHGSRHSSDPRFVAATGARHVVFSTGHANRYRHPAREVGARWRAAGASTWDTAAAGALTIRLDRRGIHLAGRRAQSPRLWDAARIEAVGAGLSYRGD